jgi:hypothetical protein
MRRPRQQIIEAFATLTKNRVSISMRFPFACLANKRRTVVRTPVFVNCLGLFSLHAHNSSGMSRYIVKLIFVLFMASHGMRAQTVAAKTNIVHYGVSLPHVSLKTDCGERIDSINVVMHCGRFAAINRIPDDWSVEVVSPVSEKTELTMTAGHGSTALWHSEDLDGFATVLVFEEPQSCFDISASIKVSCYEGGGYRGRTVRFSQNQLALKRKPPRQQPSPAH